MIRAFLAAALVASSILAPIVPSAHAEENQPITEDSIKTTISQLKVSPVTSSVMLKPGSTLDYSIVVSNEGQESHKIEAYVKPYTVQNENYDVDFNNDNNRTQLSRWIKFINEDGSVSDTFTSSIAPEGKIIINYRVSVPEDVPNGGQYAVILVQANDVQEEVTTSGVQTIPRLGVIIYGRTDGENEESAKIADYRIPTFLLSGPVTASSLVSNTGNIDFESKYSFTVTSIVGTELYHDEGSYVVLPDTNRRVSFEWKSTQPMGIFAVKYRVEALGEIKEETKLVIILPIYMILIALFVLTLLIIWIIMTIRKRRERKSRLVV